MKSSLGKLELTGFSPEDLPEICLPIGFDIKTLSPEDTDYHKLKATYQKGAIRSYADLAGNTPCIHTDKRRRPCKKIQVGRIKSIYGVNGKGNPHLSP